MPDAPVQSATERKPVELTYAPPRRSWQKRLSSTVRSWARSTFNRESYISSLKSLLWVLPLTVLIWFWAEREQVVTVTNVSVHLKAPTEDSGRVIKIITDNLVHADIHGPQVDIEQVKDYLENTTISIDVDRSLTRGEHPIDLLSQLNQLPDVKNNGVTVDKCSPAVRVFIDPIIEKEVEVRPPSDYGGAAPVFTPARVKLRGPESEVDRSSRNGQLFAYVNFRQFAQQLAEGGSQMLRNVPLMPPPDMDASEVSFSPVVVQAQVEVSKLEKPAVLPFVTVMAAEPEIAKADQYRARYKNTTDATDPIHIIGPADEVAKLVSGETPAIAYFRVDLDNPDSTAPRTAPLIFDLPSGVRVADQDKKRTITYILEARPKTDQ